MRYVAGMFIGLTMVVVTIMMSGEKGISLTALVGCLILNGLGIVHLAACALLAFGQLIRVPTPEEAVRPSG